jgi:hypothetical protein
VSACAKAVNQQYSAVLCSRNVARVRSRLVTFDMCAAPDSEDVIEKVEAASKE